MQRLYLGVVLAGISLGAAPAQAEGLGLDRDRLLERLRPTYSQSTSFSPAALRYPLREGLAAEAEAARQAADEQPSDADARWKAAVAADQAEDPKAGDQWRLALGLIEARMRAAKGNPDPDLMERHVQALVGADVGVRAVPAAEALLALRPKAWRAQLLAGDAYFRRADFNWRVLVQKSAGTSDLAGPQVTQTNDDLAACRRAYDTAVTLAPHEPAPRAARIGLRLALPIMVSFLPKVVQAPEKADLTAVRRDLLELVSGNAGKVGPLWHAAHFFAALSEGEGPLTEAERAVLEQGAAKALPSEPEQVFLEEARGLLCVLKQDWEGARRALEAALARSPGRSFAAEWLALTDAVSPDPRAAVLARVRKRLETRPCPQDHTLLGMVLAEEDRAAAIRALRQAISLEVENANARYNLGLLLLRQNLESLEARHHLERALEIRPHDLETRFAHAVTLLLDGDQAGATRTLNSLLKQADLDDALKTRLEATLHDLPPAPIPNPVQASQEKKAGLPY